MSSIEQLKHQLDTLEDLGDIVATMKALSAASIRQYEASVRSLADYYRTIELGFQVLLHQIQPPDGLITRPLIEEVLSDGSRNRQARTGSDKHSNKTQPRFGALLFGSDHGLCGRFNADLLDYARQGLNTAAAQLGSDRPPRLLTVGARMAAQVEAAGWDTDENFFAPGAAARITASVEQILICIDAWQRESALERISLYYNRPASGGGYESAELGLLPLDLKRLHQFSARTWPSRRRPDFQMDPDALFQALLRQYFFVVLFRACAASLASEHASRLAAMQAAEKNLEERGGELRVRYRRQRQAQITSELLDLIAGFESSEPDPAEPGIRP